MWDAPVMTAAFWITVVMMQPQLAGGGGERYGKWSRSGSGSSPEEKSWFTTILMMLEAMSSRTPLPFLMSNQGSAFGTSLRMPSAVSDQVGRIRWVG